MYQNHVIGKYGEDFAVEYLIDKGYTIIERNFSCKQGEIDIIAKDGNELVFVEVKTRSSTHYGSPIDAITPCKIKHLLNAIKYYLYIFNCENSLVRIDVIEVYNKHNVYSINHLKGVVG